MASPMAAPPRSEARRLIAWFAKHRRDLPWRLPAAAGTLAEPAPPFTAAAPGAPPAPLRDPYATWISEIMLQQTQVATVMAYYRRWMERFPDVATLACAPEAEVLAQWAGLGYYSRARNILETARRIASEKGGAFPWKREDLLALKGIGEYTAGAICSLAFGLPEPILDGNLVRVFSRLYGLDFLPGTAEGKKAYWDLARAWAAAGPPAAVNEALMELGALVCAPRNPACGACPLAGGCRARADGRQESLPPPKARPAGREIKGIALVASRGSDVLVYRPPRGELLAGLLTFPVFAVSGPAGLRGAWKERLPGLPLPELRPRPQAVSHSVTHNRFRLRVYEGRLEKGARSELPEGFRWLARARIEDSLVSSLPRKIWRSLG